MGKFKLLQLTGSSMDYRFSRKFLFHVSELPVTEPKPPGLSEALKALCGSLAVLHTRTQTGTTVLSVTLLRTYLVSLVGMMGSRLHSRLGSRPLFVDSSETQAAFHRETLPQGRHTGDAHLCPPSGLARPVHGMYEPEPKCFIVCTCI